MNEINILLDDIFKCLEQVKAPLTNLMNPGIDKDYIDAMLVNALLHFPEDLYTLYAWHNGVNDHEEHLIGNITLFTLGIFIPFERSCEIYRLRAGEDEYWPQSRFPVFESGGGELYLIECNPVNENYGMIYYHDISSYLFDTVIGKFDSLKTLLEAINECYNKGLYAFDKERMFTITNPRNANVFFRKHNPRCKQYWDLLLG